MIPAHLAEDMIRACNLSLWTTRDHRVQAEGLLQVLMEYMQLYGPSRFKQISGVDMYRLRKPRKSLDHVQPQLLTTLRILRGLGLRVRIESDPDPRDVMRPLTKRLTIAEKLAALDEVDATGESSRQEREKLHKQRERLRYRDKMNKRKMRAELAAKKAALQTKEQT